MRQNPPPLFKANLSPKDKLSAKLQPHQSYNILFKYLNVGIDILGMG